MTLKGLFKLKMESFCSRVYTITTCAVFGSLLYIPTQIMANDDAYLRELEAEANKTERLNTKQSKTHPLTKKNVPTTPSPNNPPTSSSTKVQAELEKFGQLLKFERPSTYRFFKRLKMSEKKQVLNDYNQHKKIRESSKLIFHLYFRHK